MSDPEKRDWEVRVREADDQAERAFQAMTGSMINPTPEEMSAAALVTIAAELRAQRIAQRPGAAMAPPPSSPADKERYFR